jgi:hypothetical protein
MANLMADVVPEYSESAAVPGYDAHVCAADLDEKSVGDGWWRTIKAPQSQPPT